MLRYQKIELSIRHVLETISIVSLMISLSLAIFSVIMRYFFGSSFQVLEEITRYFIIFSVFSYIGPLIIKNEHIKTDFIESILKGKMKHFRDIILDTLIFLAFVIIFWASVQWVIFIKDMNLLTESGGLLLYIPAMAIPFGTLFAIFYALLQVVIDFKTLRTKD